MNTLSYTGQGQGQERNQHNDVEDEEKYVIEKDDEIQHVEATGGFDNRRGSVANDTWADIKAEAERSEAHEHSLTVWESLRLYKAVSGLIFSSSLYPTRLLPEFWTSLIARDMSGCTLLTCFNRLGCWVGCRGVMLYYHGR